MKTDLDGRLPDHSRKQRTLQRALTNAFSTVIAAACSMSQNNLQPKTGHANNVLSRHQEPEAPPLKKGTVFSIHSPGVTIGNENTWKQLRRLHLSRSINRIVHHHLDDCDLPKLESLHGAYNNFTAKGKSNTHHFTSTLDLLQFVVTA